jgi:hypothetical protein
LIDFELWLDKLPPFGEPKTHELKYKIVEDTDIGLVAVHTQTWVEGKQSNVYAEVVLINKVSNDFRQIGFTEKTNERLRVFAGTCSVST